MQADTDFFSREKVISDIFSLSVYIQRPAIAIEQSGISVFFSFIIQHTSLHLVLLNWVFTSTKEIVFCPCLGVRGANGKPKTALTNWLK